MSTGWLWRTFAACGLGLLFVACGPVYKASEYDGTNRWMQVKLPKAKFAEGKILRVLAWGGYFAPHLIELFENTYGVKVLIDTGETNYELLQKLTAPGARYDLVMPTGFMVETMVRRGLLQPLDLSKLPLRSGIPAYDLNRPSDPRGEYSVPYYHGSLGFAFRVKDVDGLPSSWEFWRNPRNIEIYSGRIAFPNDARFTIGSALLYLGYSPDTTNRAELDQALALLTEFRRAGNRFASDDVAEMIVKGEVVVAWMWSGDAAVASKTSRDVRFLISDGPVIVFYDCFSIPRQAREVELAHFFVNFLLIPEIAGEMTSESGYMTTVPAARAFMDRTISNGPASMMPLIRDRVELKDLGEFTEVYEELFAKVKAVKSDEEPSPLSPQVRDHLNADEDEDAPR